VESDPTQDFKAEIELLRRVGQGDRRSFEELYDRFSGVLFSIAFRMLRLLSIGASQPEMVV
jgi:hypothetical protein